MSYGDCCEYFKNKCIEWNNAPPHYHVGHNIKNKGKSGLVQEFRNDYTFQNIVCPYVKEYAQGKEKEQLSEIVKEGIAIVQGDLLGIEIDLIVAAVLEACGYKKDASNLVKIVVGGLILAGAIGLLAIASSSSSSKKSSSRKGSRK
ncbi:MAG: hypothetical protein KGI19_06880 [Thaumarchaeota archaeon]|nr:hypothetical protein [Nitrososphaerota archaeon]